MEEEKTSKRERIDGEEDVIRMDRARKEESIKRRAGLLLMAVVEHGEDEDVEFCVKELDADINYRRSYSETPLILAIKWHRLSKIQLLLELGADVGFPAPGFYDPLNYAIRHGHEKVVKMLLDRGAVLYDDHFRTADSSHSHIVPVLFRALIERDFTTVIVSGLLESSNALEMAPEKGIKEFLTEGVYDPRILIQIASYF